jgi:hypothetical protein
MLLSKYKGRNLTGKIELPQGTLDLLILRTLLSGPQHGWAISERVQQVSREALRSRAARCAVARSRAMPALSLGPILEDLLLHHGTLFS